MTPFKRLVWNTTMEIDEEIEFIKEKNRPMSRSRMSRYEDEWPHGKGGKAWRHILKKRLKKGKKFSKQP
jgi:hypothetical protein